MTIQEDDFDHLLALHVEGKTSWCELPECGEGAALLVAPANESNVPYRNAQKKMGAKRPRQAHKTSEHEIALELHEWLMKEDRILFPKHVIKGWRAIKKKDGTPADFSPEACAFFVSKLPNYLFWRVRNHAMIPENFLQEEDPDSAELAKN